jgi:ADP-ribose pyrophosphatase
MELKKWKPISDKPAFQNKWWDIRQETVELPDGSVIDDFFVNHSPDGVVVVPVTAGGNVVVNRQYKHGAREIVTELAIGRHDNGEADPMDAAKRELMEETGYSGGEWERLSTLAGNPTSSTSRLHFFLARGVTKTSDSKEDPREQVEVREVTPAEFVAMAEDGRLKTQASVAAAFLAMRRLGWIRNDV